MSKLRLVQLAATWIAISPWACIPYRPNSVIVDRDIRTYTTRETPGPVQYTVDAEVAPAGDPAAPTSARLSVRQYRICPVTTHRLVERTEKTINLAAEDDRSSGARTANKVWWVLGGISTALVGTGVYLNTAQNEPITNPCGTACGPVLSDQNKSQITPTGGMLISGLVGMALFLPGAIFNSSRMMEHTESQGEVDIPSTEQARCQVGVSAGATVGLRSKGATVVERKTGADGAVALEITLGQAGGLGGDYSIVVNGQAPDATEALKPLYAALDSKKAAVEKAVADASQLKEAAGHLDQARKYQTEQKYREARGSIESCLVIAKTFATSPENHACVEFEKVLTKEQAPVLAREATSLLQADQLDKASGVVNECLKIAPQQSDCKSIRVTVRERQAATLLAQAKERLRRRDYDAALKATTECIELGEAATDRPYSDCSKTKVQAIGGRVNEIFRRKEQKGEEAKKLTEECTSIDAGNPICKSLTKMLAAEDKRIGRLLGITMRTTVAQQYTAAAIQDRFDAEYTATGPDKTILTIYLPGVTKMTALGFLEAHKIRDTAVRAGFKTLVIRPHQSSDTPHGGWSLGLDKPWSGQ